jgi:tRNA nucleotidyltransferase (CCA-adding enzyme)
MQEVFKTIKPSTAEQAKVKKVINAFIKKLNSKLKDAKAILGGSGAKDTWLSGNHDIDIFVQYDLKKYKEQSAELSDLLKDSLKKAFPKIKPRRLHGSRDYFQLFYQKYNFEVVPIIKITKSEAALNITDISPLHAIWVNKHTKKLKDDIRLAKQFCRANKLYGAESYISGFSGYVLEILIANFGSFNKFLKAIINMRLHEVIDPEKYYHKKDVFFELNKSKLNSAIIVIDPVDKSRNAAAALSQEKFMLLKKVAREYLNNPSKDFYEKKEINFNKLSKTKRNLVFITLEALPGKEDVVGMRLLKAFKFLKKELAKFELKKFGWDWDKKKKAVFYFILKQIRLPDVEMRQGPPLKMENAVKAFKKKNKDTFEKSGRIFSRDKVEFPELDKFVKNVLKDKYFKEKVKSVKDLKVV